MAETAHVLTVVIPALNEEDAIGDTIQRCLDAREHITSTSGVSEVEIIVVSDGSTDRTEEIAKGFDEVTTLVFEKNRGYGAALKCGFGLGRGDLVSFLDGDGTCDPRFFSDMCRALDEQEADLVLGSRMGAQSEMPLIRTIGNTIYAWILSGLSQRTVDDTASGMRVIRRSALKHLYPLPDGLHFTPAMSARVLLEDRLRLVELPMAYSERTGDSKLSVVKDGIRFLTTIIKAAVTFRPARPLLLVAGLLGLFALAVIASPALYWAERGELAEPMIYRVLLASLLAISTLIVGCAAVVADRIAAAAHSRQPTTTGVTGVLARLLTPRIRTIGGAALLVAAIAVVWPGIVQFLTTGETVIHWSRPALASLLLVAAANLGVTVFLLSMMELIESQHAIGSGSKPPDRIHRAQGRV
jgi:glycosyltransferase involved in cell wall biosynthesis